MYDLTHILIELLSFLVLADVTYRVFVGLIYPGGLLITLITGWAFTLIHVAIKVRNINQERSYHVFMMIVLILFFFTSWLIYPHVQNRKTQLYYL